MLRRPEVTGILSLKLITRVIVPSLLVCALLTGAVQAAALNPMQTVEQARFAVVSSELSPAVLVHCTDRSLTVFGGLKHWGLGAPSHIAWAGPKGMRILGRAPGASLNIPPAALSAPWLLLWFRGAAGWSAWDSPWLVVLQHRPGALRLDPDGLHLTGSIGDVVMMPISGLRKPDTNRWDQGLPGAVIHACRFWSSVLRNYPIRVDETFQLHPGSDAVIVRDRFHWLPIRDDWHTAPMRLAPLSPTLALARAGGRMPMSLSGPVTDPGLFTSFGPYVGVANADGYEVRFPVLHYITQTETARPPEMENPVVKAAMERLQRSMTEAFSSPDGLFHQDFGDPPHFADPPPQQSDGGNTCWAAMSDQYYCRALPYVTAALAARAKPRLRRYFADWLLQPARFKPFKGKLLLVGPGIGTWGGYDDAGKFSSNTLITLWTYAHETGDRDLIRLRWPLILKLFVTPRESSWRGFGRDTIAEMGDEAAPPLAMARLAYLAGDRKTFAYASYIFVRELAHLAVKNTGAGYFVANQPVNSPERMPPDVYLTNLWGDTAGWQIDGPTYPHETGERQYTNRWVRFGDPDVARFYRDRMGDLARRELDGLLASGRFTIDRKGPVDDPHILPSMVRLRSLLLNDSPESLAKITPVDAPTGCRGGDAAYCLSFLRASRPRAFEAVIPGRFAPAGWQQGLEQDRPEDEAVLDVQASGEKPGPPALTWWGWKPPATDAAVSGGDRWSFGQLIPSGDSGPGVPVRLSWNTAALLYPARSGK